VAPVAPAGPDDLEHPENKIVDAAMMTSTMPTLFNFCISKRLLVFELKANLGGYLRRRNTTLR
jgi:hypothetical protein